MRRDVAILAGAALVIGLVMASAFHQPGYTDAYYYFNAAQRWVQGKGLTDAALWTYLGASDHLPAPSHLYWMPLASVVQAAGLWLGGGAFHAAQIPLILCYAGLVVLGYGVGVSLGKSRRMGWLAGLLTLFSGFLTPYWTMTDTFAVYGLVGAGSLAAMGMGRARGGIGWWALSGALAGLAHLTRADGILLLIVLIIVALWPHHPRFVYPSLNSERVPGGEAKILIRLGGSVKNALIGLLAYLLIMSPWFVRNLNEVGSPLPVGGFQTAWMRSYDEIANYPPGTTLSSFLSWGVGNIIASRWDAFIGGLGTLWTFIAVEGSVILTPLMLLALWRRRFDPFLSGFALYALGLHLAMTLVFAFPGPRGGLLHSASALVPFWAALGVMGLDEAITWAAKRRRWPVQQARNVFSVAIVIFAMLLSGVIFFGAINKWNTAGSVYRQLAAALPSNAVVMVNDPPAFYYQTGLSGVVVPNAPPDVIPIIAAHYGVTHLILDANRTVPMNDLYLGKAAPPFLKLIYSQGDIRMFQVIQ